MHLENDPQSPGDIILKSFRLMKTTWSANLAIIVPIYLICIAVVLILGWHTFGKMHNLPNDTSLFSQIPGHFYAIDAIVWLLAFILYGILIRASWNKAQNGTPDYKNAISIGLKKIPIYIAKIIILAVIYFVILLIMNALIAAKLYWLSALVTWILYLGFYYILGVLMLVEPAAVIDDKGFSAFTKSWQLVSGHWWRTIGVIFFTHFIYAMLFFLTTIGLFLVIVAPATMPYNYLFAAMKLSHPSWFAILFMIVFIVSMIGYLITMPSIGAANLTLYYNDLKKRRSENNAGT